MDIHTYLQAFPQLPTDLGQLIPFLTSAEVLLAIFILYLQLPFLKDWADWQKGAVYVVVAWVISSAGIVVQKLLTPDLLTTLQPFYEKFTVILTLILGYFGLRNAVVRPVRVWWGTLIESRKLRNDEKQATTAAINRASHLKGTMPQGERG